MINETLKIIKNIFLKSFIFGIIIKILFPNIPNHQITIIIAVLIVLYDWKTSSILKLNKQKLGIKKSK
ncbi:hypothetical protein HMPREF1092_03097 [Clostridium thermobutyricum]|uniref:Uncharacterized protein n=1 Tax=Clostridium thermobutyricum TaxID=29372 RepID=N9WAA7_9CLOT|nr:hypothetical protein HMPREF1092_03097 [Clostridium thermobutyricum]